MTLIFCQFRADWVCYNKSSDMELCDSTERPSSELTPSEKEATSSPMMSLKD